MTDEPQVDPPVPNGVERTGPWLDTHFGTARRLEWLADYESPLRGHDGTLNENFVRATALQAPSGQIDIFGIEINVKGDLALDEALLIAAAIRDVARKIEEAVDAQQ